MPRRNSNMSRLGVRRDHLNAGEGSRLFYQKGVIPDYYICPAIRVERIKGKGLGVVATGNILKSEIIDQRKARGDCIDLFRDSAIPPQEAGQ